MFDTENLSLILRSMKFAAAKHRVQRRKDIEESAYINHPIEVAETLHSVGGVSDIPTLVAAILHDTIEDTGTKPDEIKMLFGEEVLSIVLEVTDDKSLPKAERKRLQIETAPTKSLAAKQIRIADKISNIWDLTNAPPHDWSLQRKIEYLDWTERLVAGLRGTNDAMERCYDEALANGRRKLSQASINVEKLRL
jgi:GTP diphosphokinase / guanosine-3',5'-bis(diphosphate) 3'-diphosphatase